MDNANIGSGITSHPYCSHTVLFQADLVATGTDMVGSVRTVPPGACDPDEVYHKVQGGSL